MRWRVGIIRFAVLGPEWGSACLLEDGAGILVSARFGVGVVSPSARIASPQAYFSIQSSRSSLHEHPSGCPSFLSARTRQAINPASCRQQAQATPTVCAAGEEQGSAR